MFSPRNRALSVREEQLRSLRLSLNTPELGASELPTGPARGAIALHQEPDGSRAISVVVQSLGSGELVCWSWDEPVDAEIETRVTEAALSFGESMGFLFDEDAFAAPSPDVRRVALDHWWELVGWPTAEAESASLPAILDPIALASEPETIELAAPLVDEAPDGSVVAHLPVLARAAREGLPLTKFRRRLGPTPVEAGAPAPDPKPQASALGRLRLVKKIRSGEAGRRPSLWLRLLGSF
jgi:hypothetical protein